MATITYSPLRDDADLHAVATLLSHTFATPPARTVPYYESRGKQNVRLALLEQRIAATLMFLPMGQFWGGRSVGMVGIAVVMVTPEHRGRGVGLQLMQAAVRELHDTGCPLSTLFPATLPIYRAVGYESAGASCEIRVQTPMIDTRESRIYSRPIGPDDLPTVHDLYRHFAALNPGMLDRSPPLWERITHKESDPRHGYLLIHSESDRAQGYLIYSQKDPSADHHGTLEITDCVAATPEAARGFWQFLANHRTVVRSATWTGPPMDPLLLIPRDHCSDVSARGRWMLRIVRLADALTLRGYSTALSGQLRLAIDDDLLPENQGNFLLTVRDGQATVERGGDGTFRLSIRALAPLYSGFLSPAQLVSAGLLVAPPAELAFATSLFAGPVPFMRDHF